MGRFINKDPIEEQGGLNLYGFCGNNGVNHWDYLGNSSQDIFLAHHVGDSDYLLSEGVTFDDGHVSVMGVTYGGAGSGAWGIVDQAMNNMAISRMPSTSGSRDLVAVIADLFNDGGSAPAPNNPTGTVVTVDGRTVTPSIRLGETQYLGVVDNNGFTPVAPYESWDGTMTYQTPFPSTYQSPHVANSTDLFMGVIRGFDEQASALRYGHNVGVVVALGVTTVAVAPAVAVGAVDAATNVVLAGRGAANIIQFRVGLQLAASAGSSIAERTLIAEGLELGEAAWSARAAATAAAAVRAASAGGTSPPRP